MGTGILNVCVLSGCGIQVTDSSGVNAAQIYQSYDLDYSETTNRTCGFAHFYVGSPMGNSIDLQSPAGIKFDNEPMQKQAVLGLFYSYCNDGRSLDSHTWQFTDQNKNVYTNSISIHVLAVTMPATISRSTGLNAAFTDAPLVSGETIQVLISTSSSPSVNNSVRANISNNRLILNADAFQGMSNGAATLKFTRETPGTLQQGESAGGEIHASYETPPYAVTLVK